MTLLVHRPPRLSIAALAIVAIPTLIALARPAQPAWACSCIGVDDQEAFDLADVAFRGKLIGYASPLTDLATAPVTTKNLTISSRDTATWTFAVQEVYKGDLAAVVDILSPLSGASCGLKLPREGEFYVFANIDPGSSEREPDLHASLCGGTRSVAGGPLDVEGVAPRAAATESPHLPPYTTTSPSSELPEVPQGTEAGGAAAEDMDTANGPDGPNGLGKELTPLALGLVALAAIASALALAMRRRV